MLAAVGIADARTFAEVMAADADGVRIGTRFVAATQFAAHPTYKQAIVEPPTARSSVTRSPATAPLRAQGPAPGHAQRRRRAATLTADVVGTLATRGRQLPLPRRAGLPPIAAVQGDLDAMAMYAGTGADAITDVDPVAGLISDLMAAFGSSDAGAAH